LEEALKSAEKNPHSLRSKKDGLAKRLGKGVVIFLLMK